MPENAVEVHFIVHRLGGIWEAEVDKLHLGGRHGGLRGRCAQEWEGIQPFGREPL